MKRTSKVEIRVICDWEDAKKVNREILNLFAHSNKFQDVCNTGAYLSRKGDSRVLLYFRGDVISGDSYEGLNNINLED